MNKGKKIFMYNFFLKHDQCFQGVLLLLSPQIIPILIKELTLLTSRATYSARLICTESFKSEPLITLLLKDGLPELTQRTLKTLNL